MKIFKIIDNKLASVPIGKISVFFVVLPEENERKLPGRRAHRIILLFFRRPIDLSLILITIEVGKVPGKLLEIILISGMIHDRKVDPAEHVLFLHTVVIKFL